MTRAMIISTAGMFLCGMDVLLLSTAGIKTVKLAGLTAFYLGGSMLLMNVCSFQMCVALFICGIGVVVLLGTGYRKQPDQGGAFSEAVRETLIFRLILSVMLGILAYTITERIRVWIPVRRTVLYIAVWTMLMDLICLAMDDDLLFRCIYLQSICLAFTICYVYMESSVLIFAFFAVINLMMAFGSAVLTLGNGNSDTEETGAGQ